MYEQRDCVFCTDVRRFSAVTWTTHYWETTVVAYYLSLGIGYHQFRDTQKNSLCRALGVVYFFSDRHHEYEVSTAW